jgi:poly(3-hydroxybutyrate) depolymerase
MKHLSSLPLLVAAALMAVLFALACTENTAKPDESGDATLSSSSEEDSPEPGDDPEEGDSEDPSASSSSKGKSRSSSSSSVPEDSGEEPDETDSSSSSGKASAKGSSSSSVKADAGKSSSSRGVASGKDDACKEAGTFTTVPSDPNTCVKYEGKCYTCNNWDSSEDYWCGQSDGWFFDTKGLADNIGTDSEAYWYTAMTCPAGGSETKPSSSSVARSSSSSQGSSGGLNPGEQTYAFGYALKNAPRPSEGCGKEPTLTGRSYNCDGACDKTAQLFSIDGRDYYVSFPKNYDKNKPYRIIFAMHCMGSSANHMATWDKRDRDHVSPFYALRALDTDNSTIFVAPQGNDNGTWNGEDDHKFIDKLITHLQNSYCVDTTRVFSTGFSFGAMFTNSLAQAFQHRLRGVAVYAVADYNIWLPTNTGKPIAWMGVHGTQDGMCDYNRALTSALPRILKNNGPNGTDVSSEKPPAYNGGNHACYDFKQVDPRFPVRWCSHGADHQWSATDNGDNNQTWVPQDVWKFFDQF